MSKYYAIVELLYCYDCKKRSRIINNQMICAKCGSKMVRSNLYLDKNYTSKTKRN